MTLLLLRRLGTLAVTLLAATAIVFVVMEVLPGDPAAIMLGVGAQPDTLAALRTELGLDLPVAERYGRWMLGLASGDFGRSYTYSVPVAELIGERIAVSLPLALLSMVLTVLIAIPAGVFAASHRGRFGDTGVSVLAQIGIAIPNFWFAMLLILVFAVSLGLAPAGGFAGWEAGIGPALGSLALPAVALALPQAAILTRVTRSSVLETLGEDYVRTARAKGLMPSTVFVWHVGRNSLIPVVTMTGIIAGELLGGSVVTETVFAWPGVGRLIVQAILAKDFPVVQAGIVVIAVMFVAINLAIDLLYGVLDPRIRVAG